MRELIIIRGHQRPSEAIRGHQRPSEAIRGHQRSSEAIRGHQRRTEERCEVASVASVATCIWDEINEGEVHP